MGARYADRLWMFAGAAIIVVLTVICYLFVISPKYDEADEVRGQTETTQTQIVVLRKRIAELEKQKTKLSQFKAALKRNQRALPSDSGLPDFLRQLQSSGDDVDVDVSGIAVSGPELAEGFTTVWALPITLTAAGDADDLGRFLDQLQATQPRAVLVESANLTTQGSETAADGSTDTDESDTAISLSLKAFVAPPAGSGAPTITTTKTN
jgi:type IV pilus assembly protein PilO